MRQVAGEATGNDHEHCIIVALPRFAADASMSFSGAKVYCRARGRQVELGIVDIVEAIAKTCRRVNG
jgi:hypothetical protein